MTNYARNCQVVRDLNKLIRSGELSHKEKELCVKLRDRTIYSQSTEFSESGLPFIYACKFLESKKDILKRMPWDF